MNSFTELSKEELVELTDEQIAFLVDAECADKGIPLMPPVPTQVNLEPMRGDIDVYGVDSFLFTDQERAEAVLHILRNCTLLRYEYAPGYEDRIVQVRETVPSLTMYRCFSQEKWNEVQGDYEQNRIHREATRRLQKEFEEIGSRRKTVAEVILKAVEEAKLWKSRRDMLEASIHTYLRVAANNLELAYRYFVKAYPMAVEEYPDLIRNYFPLEIAA